MEPKDNSWNSPTTVGKMVKFHLATMPEATSNHDYGRIFQYEQTSTGGQRLIIAMQEGHLSVMEELAKIMGGPWGLLYILLVPLEGRLAAGRYQSPPLTEFHFVQAVHHRFGDLLEGDGRHHYWIANTDGSGVLAYDHHNLIFAYGPVSAFAARLRALDFREAHVEIPAPHAHRFYYQNDVLLEQMLTSVPWGYGPLEPEDDY